ncbi:hypothetical protein GOP47_0022945 [Adiantum capillus-veneris]|uniref:Uncharacterized protein n=1 Tax=Adiantum capillus-veneris TaxID=13818 RepID=A0A9D4U6D9_ADICA|nr:hypothetical protein GOP47_0022945 [Adiantum capillus-veneris]
MSATPLRKYPVFGARSAAVGFALLGVLLAVASSTRFYGFLLASTNHNSIPVSSSANCKCSGDADATSSTVSVEANAAAFTGVVEDCCCDYETVNGLNDDVVHPLLQRLVQTAFFRYFKIKLWCDCPHWPNDGMCRLRDCSVCECPDDEFPSVFKARPKNQAEQCWSQDYAVWHVAEGNGHFSSPQEEYVGEDVIVGAGSIAIYTDELDGSLHNVATTELGDFPANTKRNVQAHIASDLLFQSSALPKASVPNLLPSDSLLCQEGKPGSAVDRTLDSTHLLDHWMDSRDNPWTFDNETLEDGITYVNLLLNPEKFTGYTGASPRRIWDAIYQENIEVASMQESTEEPLESRVLYKLISGLHSSISIHIAADYLLNERANAWGPNQALLNERVLKHPSRVRNLYFAYLFVLRAVTKAADYLHKADYTTAGGVLGSGEREAESTRALMMELVDNVRMKKACPKPFDEVQLWRGADGGDLLLQVQRQFRNITALMDCVGCEKCRLWGKLQVLGLGTALEILFSHYNEGALHLQNDYHHHPPSPDLHLHRNEVIALINLLNKLSESIHLLHHFELRSNLPRSSPSNSSADLSWFLGDS